MYQPKIEEEHIRALYQWGKRLNMPMTRLVNALLAHALVRLEHKHGQSILYTSAEIIDCIP